MYRISSAHEGGGERVFSVSTEEFVGEDGKVSGIKTERTALNGDGSVHGTGKFTEWPVQAVYFATGYRSDAVDGVPFNEDKNVINNDGGHVIDAAGKVVPGLYTTGWIKRGPVGLIGNTKSDATETIGMLLADAASPASPAPTPAPDAQAQSASSSLAGVQGWLGWVIAGAVALLAICVGAFSLLRR